MKVQQLFQVMASHDKQISDDASDQTYSEAAMENAVRNNDHVLEILGYVLKRARDVNCQMVRATERLKASSSLASARAKTTFDGSSWLL